MRTALWLLAAALVGTVSYASCRTGRTAGEAAPRAGWRVLGPLPQLDTARLVTIPGSEGRLYRTEVMLAFEPQVSDSAKQALFTSQSLSVLGVTHSGRFFVRFADPGPSFEAFDAFMDSLRAQPGVEAVAPINFTPLEQVGSTQPPSVSQNTVAVPALPPDTVPNWFREDSSYTAAGFLKGVVGIVFQEGTTETQRQEAVDGVGGIVIGGSPYSTGDGVYYIRVSDDGSGTQLKAATASLMALPQVEAAFLNYRGRAGDK